MYTTLIRLVALYDWKTRPFRKPEKIRSNILKRKIAKRIFGPCNDAETKEWRIRHNQELQDFFFFNALAFTKEISIGRTKWARHGRRKRGLIIKTVIENNPSGKWSLERPRLRRKDCVIGDIGLLIPGL